MGEIWPFFWKDRKRRIKENARKAKEAADRLFPGELWIQKGEYGERIYVSSHRKTGSKSNFEDELKNAKILRDLGSTVYLTPENSRQTGRKFDAIVDGMKYEFKNMQGKGISTLQEHFFSSRSQAPNVFINLENSDLIKQQVISALYSARNNAERYTRKNHFSGGIIILKIKGQEELIYLNVDNLKKPRQTTTPP